MHREAMLFVRAVVASRGPFRQALEIGSYNVNGSVRDLFPGAEYVGLDSRAGPGVDVVGDGATWRPADGQVFDCVVCTEVLEHAPDPAAVVCTAFESLAPGGVLILTAASEHRAPHSCNGDAVVPPGEHYAGIPAHRLRAWLDGAGFAWFDVENGYPPDVYAVAVR
jgi:SAM-dependent methyltransferase